MGKRPPDRGEARRIRRRPDHGLGRAGKRAGRGNDLFGSGPRDRRDVLRQREPASSLEIEGCATGSCAASSVRLLRTPGTRRVANMDTAVYDSIQRFDEFTNSVELRRASRRR